MKISEIVYFNNYDGFEDEAIEWLRENGNDDEVLSQDDVYRAESIIEEDYWDECNTMMNKFIESGKSFIAVGTCGLWDGNYDGGLIFGHWDDFKRRVFKDCGYFKIWEERGHLYVRCSHHDGTHSLEIKELTDKGFEYYSNWQYSPLSDPRTERDVHKTLFTDSHYSHLPRVFEKVYESEVA